MTSKNLDTISISFQGFYVDLEKFTYRGEPNHIHRDYHPKGGGGGSGALLKFILSLEFKCLLLARKWY